MSQSKKDRDTKYIKLINFKILISKQLLLNIVCSSGANGFVEKTVREMISAP